MSTHLEGMIDARFTPLSKEESREVLGGLDASTATVATFVAHTFVGDGTWVPDHVADDDAQPVSPQPADLS